MQQHDEPWSKEKLLFKYHDLEATKYHLLRFNQKATVLKDEWIVNAVFWSQIDSLGKEDYMFC